MEEKNMYREYLDPQYELFEYFRKAAPGSAKHCQNVRNICETIASELKLDVEKLAVAALYHDVGKMYNPSYFIENQEGKSPHDELDPFVSYQIITRHVGDTILELIKYDFPLDVIKIASQHHGNTILKPFFDKSDSDIEDSWRYKCATPDSTEAIVLMVVDCIEATARSRFMGRDDVDKETILDLVENRIHVLEQDKQLDDMKIGIMRVVKSVLCKEIESMYHKRIEYPVDENDKDAKKKTKKKEKVEEEIKEEE